MEELKDLISREPQNIEAKMKLVELYIDTQDYANALTMLEEVISIDPNQIQANFILAQIYEHDEIYTQAVEAMEKVVKQNNADELRHKLASLYEHVDNYAKALDIYKELFEAEPSDIHLCERIAHAHRILGNDDEAVYYYNKILIVEPENIVALLP